MIKCSKSLGRYRECANFRQVLTPPSHISKAHVAATKFTILLTPYSAKVCNDLSHDVIRLFPTVKTHFLTPKVDMLVIGAILDQFRGFFGNTLSKMDRSMLKSRKMCQKTAATYTLLAPLHLKVRQVVVHFNQRR